jgi:hypothetical protein
MKFSKIFTKYIIDKLSKNPRKVKILTKIGILIMLVNLCIYFVKQQSKDI